MPGTRRQVQVPLLGAPRGGQLYLLLGQLGVMLLLVMAMVLLLCSFKLRNELMLQPVHCAVHHCSNLTMVLNVTSVGDGIIQCPSACTGLRPEVIDGVQQLGGNGSVFICNACI